MQLLRYSDSFSDCYEWDSEGNPGCFSVYAIEYKTGEDGYIKVRLSQRVTPFILD